MMLKNLRVLVLGGDPGLRAALEGAVVPYEVAFVPVDLDLGSLLLHFKESDVLVVAEDRDAIDPFGMLRRLRGFGVLHRTVFVASTDAYEPAAEAMQLGIGAYLQPGTVAEMAAAAVVQVGRGGVLYDAPAAASLKGNSRSEGAGSEAPLNAARALAHALELKDTCTGGHAGRVTQLALRLARLAQLPDAMPSEALEAAFLLHDVGKIGIPESILNKPGRLTETEWRLVQSHPLLGEQIIAPLNFPVVVREVVRHHHERWDGGGYPDGLAGVDIPAAARLFQIADVFDAMTSIRPYRRQLSFEDAVQEIRAGAGSQFDPGLSQLAAEILLSPAAGRLAVAG